MALSRFVWGVCLAASASFYLFADSSIGLLVVIAVVGIPLIGIFANQLFSRTIRARLSVGQSVEKNEDLDCELVTFNKSMLPLAPVSCEIRCRNILTGERYDATVLYPVGGNSSFPLPFSFAGAHCGCLEVTVAQIRAFDVFGLFSTRHRIDEKASSVILPKTFAPTIMVVPNLSKDIEADEYSQSKAGFDPGETFAIRDYRPGDNLKQIHWKLTSKFDSLIVKELGLPVRHSFLLMLETFCPEGTPTDAEVSDALAEIMVSLCQTLVEEEVSFDVCWQDHEEQLFARYTIATMDDLTGILERLLRAYAAPGTGDVLSCYTDAFGASDFEHLVYVSRFLPPTISTFIGNGQMTAIVCADDVLGAVVDEVGGYTVHYCTPHNYEAELSTLEI